MHSLSLRLHFEVHKRIWQQHICGEAVLQYSWFVLAHPCFGMYFFKLYFLSTIHGTWARVRWTWIVCLFVCVRLWWRGGTANSSTKCASGLLSSSSRVSHVFSKTSHCASLLTPVWTCRARQTQVLQTGRRLKLLWFELNDFNSLMRKSVAEQIVVTAVSSRVSGSKHFPGGYKF